MPCCVKKGDDSAELYMRFDLMEMLSSQAFCQFYKVKEIKA